MTNIPLALSEGGTPSIFADLILDLLDFRVILNVERPGWPKKAQELQPQAKRVGLVMRDTGEVAVWLDTDRQPFECFSRVVGRISLEKHTQERRACIRCDGAEVWIDDGGQIIDG